MSRPRWSLVGPLLRWELVRLARRGQATRCRVLFLYTWLLALIGSVIVWSYPSNFTRLPIRLPDSLPVAEAAQLAHRLIVVLFEVQLLFVAIVAPAYAVAALAEEKDRHTLALVLTTDLTDREIVWGKAMACVIHMLAAVAAGVPLLVIMAPLGVIDLPFLAVGYALTLGTTLLATAIGITAASHAPDSRRALVRAYSLSAVLVGALVLPPFVVFSPFAMLLLWRMPLQCESLRLVIGVGYPLGQAILASGLLWAAMRHLRQAGPSAGPPTPTAFPEPPRGRLPVLLLAPRVEPPVLPPLASTDPVLWKERHVGLSNSGSLLATPTRWLAALVTVLALVLFVSAGWMLLKRALLVLDPSEVPRLTQLPAGAPDRASLMLVIAGSLASGLYLVPLAIGITASIARERHQATLDSLLATPLGRRRLLGSKVQAHLERGLVFAVGAIVGFGSGFGLTGGWQFGLAAIGAFGAGCGLVAGASAWLSVRCATALRAFRLCLPVLVPTLAFPPIVWLVAPGGTPAAASRVLLAVAAVALVLGIGLFWQASSRLARGE